MENSEHRRVSRSVKKENTLLTAKNEIVPLKKKSPQEKEFENLVKSMFDKIHIIYSDSDIEHLDYHMNKVFEFSLPVFYALHPHELIGDQEIAKKERAADKTSEESSEEKKQRVARTADKTSVE